MNCCERCMSLMDETSTVCDRCGHEVSRAVADPDLQAVEPDPAADLPELPDAPARAAEARPSPTGGRTLSSRQISVLALAIVGAGVVTLGWLTLRGSAATQAATIAAPHAVAPAAKPAAAPRPPVTATARWSRDHSARWVGNARRSVAFELPAEKRVAVWMRTVQPLLVVRCTAGDVEVFVYTESAAKIEPQTEDHTVSYALDDEVETTERWEDSADHDGLFTPDGAGFAGRLSRARAMRFGFTPHNAAPVTVLFNVAGLADMMAPAARECAAPAASHRKPTPSRQRASR